MNKQYMGLRDISGSLAVIDRMDNASYDEIVEVKLDSGESRIGRIVELTEEFAVVQVFEAQRACLWKTP